MTRKGSLPVRVYLRRGRYFYVTLPDRKWLPLTRESEGMPAMWRALAVLVDKENRRGTMPEVIARWLASKRPEWSEGVAEDQDRIATHMAEAWADFQPSDVSTPACAEYLRRYAHQPRTHNMHRTMLRGVLALAAIEGLREGHNPVDNIAPMKLQKRKRIVTDAEVQALREAAQAGRYGHGLVHLIDMALITGQRVGDLLALRWQDVTDDGIQISQGKGGGAVKLLIEWSPALRAAMARCAERGKLGHVIKTETGRGYTYGGIRSDWVRVCERAGVEGLTIHDLRGRAGVDALGQDEDIRSAQRLLGHSGEAMTRHYVGGKYHRRVKPAR